MTETSETAPQEPNGNSTGTNQRNESPAGTHAGEAAAARSSPAQPDAQPGTPPESAEQRLAELEDRWRRTQADLDNLRKRSVQELARVRAEERARVAAAMLPILDNLDLALEHAQADPATITAGVQGVRDQAIEVLNRLGFARRADEGAPFDPGVHEAVAVQPEGTVPPGTVVRVVRPGYGDAEHLLRPAAVVVAQGR